MAGEFPDVERQAFLDAVDALDPSLFKLLAPREPRSFAGEELPAIAMLFTAAPDEDLQTGPATTVTWTFRVNVYADTVDGYEPAQETIEKCVPRVLQAVRRDPSCGLDGRWFRIADPGGEIEFSDEEQLAWKRLTLTIEKEELS